MKVYIQYSLLILLVSSCSTAPQQEQDLDPTVALETAQQQAVRHQVIRPDSKTSYAIKSLLIDARDAARSGNITRAESLLERALRIEPQNAILWHYMAKMNLHQGRYSKAKGLAAKSNSLAAANKMLQADNWRIIAHAENRLGHIDEMQKAQQQIDRLIP